MKEYIEIIECRDCESKNCYGCNILTLAEMLNNGAFDCMMDEHHFIIPAADVVERKRGEWVRDNHTLVHCSMCKVARNAFFGVGGNEWNFCPNCGCQMVGDSDGRD